MTITTNHHAYPILYWHDLTRKEQADNDWGAEDHSFVRYRGNVIPMENFMRTEFMDEWDGIAPTSYFSGVAIKLSNDGETCKLATIYL